MAIEFNCPHCGAFYRLDEKFAGKMGKCKNAKCQQKILIPFQSTATSNKPVAPGKKVDAEALAAAAFSEEAPPPQAKEAAPTKKMGVTCQFCEHKFEVDAAMAGKNTACPECRKIIRVPKPVEDKPSDWRSATGGRPSMAKAAEPVPAGAWDAQRKGVSGEALRKAGALEVEDEDDRRERRMRNLKRTLYGLALLGMIALGVRFVLKNRGDAKQEQLMTNAVKEVEDKNEGSKKPEFHAAIHRFAGEYFMRLAKKRDDVQPALDHFSKALGELQNLPPGNPDRNAMLVELGTSMVVCGGEGKELSDEIRLSWDHVHPLIRKCLDKIPPGETELRNRSLRLLTRKLAEKNQGVLASTVARNCGADDTEKAELMGRVGIELFLLGKKDLAEQVLNKLPKGAQPASTALWLALHAQDLDVPAENFPHVLPPDAKGPKGVSRDSRLAYAEGRALQERWDAARKIAESPGSVTDRVEALCRVAAVAQDTGKFAEAAPCLDSMASILKANTKEPGAGSWLLVCAAELAAKANKWDVAQAILDLMKDDSFKSWAKLELLRIKLASQRKEKADETWVENVPDPASANLAQGLQREEVARHNAAAGESSYTRTVEALPKGTLRPFGYAGMALGTQDKQLR